MQRYANVHGERRLPFPGGKGSCPSCATPVIAKCGPIKAHHWSHQSKADCDLWSESIGPWHLAWQDLVRPEFLEVPKGPHRADIVGNSGVVVELQHSPISSDDIRAREAFYGEMVWLFDATYRFRKVESGQRVFFSLGQVKHLQACQKPVFLDFGNTVVEVDQFTSVLWKCSGFGWRRNQSWFAERFLSDCLRSDAVEVDRASDTPDSANPWETKCPYAVTRFPTRWIEPESGTSVTLPSGTPYIPLNYDWKSAGAGRRPVWSDLIDQYPQFANGWSKQALHQMVSFLFGTPVIIDGLLRVMPRPMDRLKINTNVQSTTMLLEIVDEHIAAGRVPVLKEQTKRHIVDLAKRYEVEQYGREISRPSSKASRDDPAPSLFNLT